MEYLIVPVLLLQAFYAHTYASYNWRKKAYGAAMGVYLIIIFSIILPIVFIALR